MNIIALSLAFLFVTPFAFAKKNKDCLLGGRGWISSPSHMNPDDNSVDRKFLYKPAMAPGYERVELDTWQECYQRAITESKKFQFKYKGGDGNPFDRIQLKKHPNYLAAVYFNWAYGGGWFRYAAKGTISRYTDIYDKSPKKGNRARYSDGEHWDFRFDGQFYFMDKIETEPYGPPPEELLN